MLAKLVQGKIDPSRVDAAAAAVERELVPSFVVHPGALQGYWMANRASGEVLVMTCWTGPEELEAGRAADGEARAAVMERLGVRVHAVQTLSVVGVEESHDTAQPVVRFARATWVEKLTGSAATSLDGLHREAVRMQASSPGFCASYWLADRATGNGLALSLWDGPDDLQRDEVHSRRRRKWFQQMVGCRIDLISEYEAIGAVASSVNSIDLTDLPVTS